MFWGFISLWTICALCAASNADAIWAAIFKVISLERGPFSWI